MMNWETCAEEESFQCKAYDGENEHRCETGSSESSRTKNKLIIPKLTQQCE